jgi:hypothetical protein
MKANFAAGFALLATLILPASLSAKGPTLKIIIKGASLTAPIEITDPGIRDFNVWAGPGVRINGVDQTQGFIVDWPKGAIAERQKGLPRYEVSFYANHQGERVVYVVSYEYNPATGLGYVYLPGKADEWYELNTFSIYRGGLEGDWFHAASRWDDFVRPIIARAKTVDTQ